MKRVVRNKGYDASITDFDFSLLELDHELTFNDRIKPITLPNENILIEDGANALVTGWGEQNRLYYNTKE